MNGEEGAVARGDDPCVPDSIEEARVLWQFCSALADRIWRRHEDELIEWLTDEERDRRCEEHPWQRRPCTTCEADAEPKHGNLELVFEENGDVRD